MNLWDWLILAAVACLLVLAIRRMRKNRKNGSCSCGCGGCVRNGSCPACRPQKETGQEETAERDPA